MLSIQNRDVRRAEALPSGNSQPNEGDRPSGSKDPERKHLERGGTKGPRSLGRPPGGDDSSLKFKREWQFSG